MPLTWGDGRPFTIGSSRFADHLDEGQDQATSKIYVPIELEPIAANIMAQLDTGSAWSVLQTEFAEALSLLDGAGEPTALQTRLGVIHGYLERTRIRLVANEGQSLSIETTFFVSRHWTAKTFLGYSAMLDHIRFAVDPRANTFHFGD